MRYRVFTGASALALAAALSVSASRAAPVPRCEAVVSALPKTVTVGSAAPTESGGCLFRDATIGILPRQAWHAEEVETGPLDPAAPDFAKMESLRLVARQIGFRLRTESPVTNFIQNSRNPAFDNLALDYTFDAPHKVFHLNRFVVTGRSIRMVRLAAVLDGVGPADLEAPASLLTKGGISSIELELDNEWGFEGFVMPLLIGQLTEPGADPEMTADPQAAFGRLKAKLITAATTLLTKAGVPPASVAAVSAFAQAIPHPAGDFHLQASFPTPLKMADLHAIGKLDAPDGPSDPTGVLKRLSSLTASYTPAPPPPRMAP